MLPYTPLHHLLLRELGRPMVLTSGNTSDEPIAYDDEDALARLAGIADAFCVHDRPIHMRTDDSVVRAFRGRETILRRSRGYVPEPIRLRATVHPAGSRLRGRAEEHVLPGHGTTTRSSPITSATWRTTRRSGPSPRGSRTSSVSSR